MVQSSEADGAAGNAVRRLCAEGAQMLCSSRLQEPVLAPDSPYVSGLPDSFCLSDRAWVSLLSEQQHETLGTPKRDCGGDPGPRKGCTEGCLHSAEQCRLAIETFIRFDHSYADTIAELGYPTRHSLRAWYKDYLEHGEARPRSGSGSPSSPCRRGRLPWTTTSHTERALPGPCARWAIPPAGSASATGSAGPEGQLHRQRRDGGLMCLST